ncbi:MAG: hypothetical protein A2161_05155 [Candidatus Schekmanbacteria bacterium RBG_13_48_7]|uniref:ABC transporter permease n=1 Tax=Candidatus Schekmanbacteria bacterium RBG_13_48_7 TaxID=1817878 RepID=A0A1F7S1V7_9BACT|nr:MAG: hypothetical protein A2161_05155 [Candidatus Schekmanbacteria bacterium RBG_13_48_7]
MHIPIIYNVRSLIQRPVSTLATVMGIAIVVAVLCGMLALATGFQKAISSTGSPDNVIVMRDGADAEISSGIPRDNVNIIASLPEIANNKDGRPMFSADIVVIINIHKIGESKYYNVTVRGVSKNAFDLRENMRIIAGRSFNPGAYEVIIGSKLVGKYENCYLDGTLEYGQRKWTVVGIFSAGETAFDSEIWGENEILMPVFWGPVFQSVTFRMNDSTLFYKIKDKLENDPRLQVAVYRESDFYSKRSQALTMVLKFLGYFVSSIMAIGAIFGAINTMNSAIASRHREIAVLLTLGFPPSAILFSFLFECILICVTGGIVGCLLALPLNFVTTSTTNWQTFTEVAFTFHLTPGIFCAGIIFAVIMGILGGFVPSWRSSRQSIAQALRQE